MGTRTWLPDAPGVPLLTPALLTEKLRPIEKGKCIRAQTESNQAAPHLVGKKAFWEPYKMKDFYRQKGVGTRESFRQKAVGCCKVTSL